MLNSMRKVFSNYDFRKINKNRRRILVLLLLLISFSSVRASNSAVLCGTIDNYHRRSIRLIIHASEPTDYQLKRYKIRIKVSSNGFFHARLNNIHHFLFWNELKIGKKKVRISLAPGDSVFITMNYKENRNIQFSGSGSAKNYFMDSLCKINMKRGQNSSSELDLFSTELNLLDSISKQYNIDSSARMMYYHLLRCHSFMELFKKEKVELTEMEASFLEEFSPENQYLKWYFYHYTNIRTYLEEKEPLNTDLYSVVGIIRAFKRGEKYLQGDYLDIYQAYIITNSMHNPSPQLENDSVIRAMIKESLINWKDDYLRKTVKDFLVTKKIFTRAELEMNLLFSPLRKDS